METTKFNPGALIWYSVRLPSWRQCLSFCIISTYILCTWSQYYKCVRIVQMGNRVRLVLILLSSCFHQHRIGAEENTAWATFSTWHDPLLARARCILSLASLLRSTPSNAFHSRKANRIPYSRWLSHAYSTGTGRGDATSVQPNLHAKASLSPAGCGMYCSFISETGSNRIAVYAAGGCVQGDFKKKMHTQRVREIQVARR